MPYATCASQAAQDLIIANLLAGAGTTPATVSAALASMTPAQLAAVCALLDCPVPASNITGVIPAANLPSYVDDVLEFVDLAGFPASGEAGKIYVDLATGKVYRWSGTTYIEISAGAPVPFATPAETIAGIDPTLAVNPPDLYARENIAAQTGLGLVLSAIPAPTASQSNWGVNTLGETLHYAPGLGWKIITNMHRASGGAGSKPLAPGFTVLDSVVMPRAGEVEFYFVTNSTYIQGQVIIAFIDTAYDGTRSDAISGVEPISSVTVTIPVVAGQVVTFQEFSAPTGGNTVNHKWQYKYVE